MNRFDGQEIDCTTQYACIGEFVVEFEFLVNKIRFQCSAILQMKGLKDWQLSEIIFGEKQFTAGPLITCFEKLCNEVLKGKSDSKEILKNITSFKNKFEKQTKFRNDLLHSTHFYGQNTVQITDKEEPSELLILKNSPDKSGHRIKVVANSIKDIQQNTMKIRGLKDQFSKITSSLLKFMDDKEMMIGFSTTTGE